MPVDEMRIGDFTKPVVPSAPSSPTEETLLSAEAKLDQDAKKDEAVLKPMASYEERLKQVGVSKEEASEIIDAVLLKGHFAKDYQITKSIKARFRTRGARDTRRAQIALEGMRLTYDHHYAEVLGRYLLAASLEQFGADVLTHPKRNTSNDEIEKQFQARFEYVEGLSEPALQILMNKLRLFDIMIATVLSEGSIENF